MLDQFNQLYSNIGVMFLNTSNAYFIQLTVEKSYYTVLLRSTPTLNLTKNSVIVVKCDKKYTILTCACPIDESEYHLALTHSNNISESISKCVLHTQCTGYRNK